MFLNDWGKLLPAWQEEFSDRFVDVEGNILFTGRGGYNYDMQENDETHKKEFVKSGVKMKIAGETPYETDLNIWMQLENLNTKKNQVKPIQTNVAYVLKDRSDTINAKIFNSPSYKNFRPVINFIKGLPTGAVTGESDLGNFAPGDDFSYIREKTKRQIQIELIAGSFDLAGLGDARSKVDKAIKVNIVQKVFGTTSSTEIEKMNSNILEVRRQDLDDLLNSIKSDEPENVTEYVKSYNLKSAA